jgi:hypothetical protein
MPPPQKRIRAFFILHRVHHFGFKNLVFLHLGIVVFSLCICHKGGQRKALWTFGMLEHSFLGCQSGSRAWYASRELVHAVESKIYTGMVGGKAFESYESYKNTETVIDEEEEGRRTMEEIYKGSAANFASILPRHVPLAPHKITHAIHF